MAILGDPYADERKAIALSKQVESGEISIDEAICAIQLGNQLSIPLTHITPFQANNAFSDNTRSLQDACVYCGNTGVHKNLRGGIECAGCGHPK